ncbi:acyltransferase family protein [Streptomyces sp. ODS28]|uniref:acyltransferase family protein n=1 Tax=Streptomyces sp. ODS28 TaxID=3136688 RepID=UPI0031F09380
MAQDARTGVPDGPTTAPTAPATPAAAPQPSTGTGRRLHYIDNLRIALTALVVLHHTAVTYGNIPAWYYTEPAKDASGGALDLLVMADQAFFMGFFFLIAGFFTPASYARKGPRPFVRDRLVRLGIPLLAFLLLLRPLANVTAFPAAREAAAEQGHGLSYGLFYVLSWDPGPLWFVEVLLVFILVYVLVRRRRGGAGAAAYGGPARLGALPVLAFGAGLAAVTYAWRTVCPTGTYVPVLGLPTPDFLPQYAGFFAVGVLAWRRGWAHTLSRRAGRLGFAAAAVATLAYVPLVLTVPGEELFRPGGWGSAATACWEAAFAIGTVCGLTVLFRERLNRQGRLAACLSRNAFAVYLVHAPLLVGLALALRWLQAPALAKFALVAALALPLCWALAGAVRRIPGVSRVL